ncbi:MAG: ATP-binding protein [Moorea sp. SIOASIH]|uniref:AAA family ATPase n=1 Tax=Moorena sp. SIOASIH TaxID=2607817 RepID=UPI0013B8EBBB|nr:ATP-binding protein [Moorena sp. SIOASIH]NEO42077.1 ATP-binding protein [Moorena sp. SIOASIH]
MAQNPFTVGQAVSPERFVGRESQIEIAFDQISSRGNLAVWGGPGIGKTSFLELLTSPDVWHLQGQDPEAAVIVLLNCLSIQPFNADSFWRQILIESKSQLDSNPRLQTDIDQLLDQDKVTSINLKQLLRKLGEYHKFLLLLVDDYDVALRTNDGYQEADLEAFVNECRSIANSGEERKYISMIVASSRRLSELGPQLTPDKSPWYNHYLFQPLKPFTDNEVAALLLGMPITPALREGIREIADGNPALLQNAGYLLYQELRANRVPDPKTFARDFLSATEQFFQATWELCNDLEQILLMLIALCSLEGRLSDKRYALRGIETIFSQKEIELNALEIRGIIKREEQAGKATYSFASSLMEWWVVKNIQNSTETELQNRQKVFLNLMSHKQAEKVKDIIRLMWKNKDKIPDIFEWIGKVIAAIPKGAIKS